MLRGVLLFKCFKSFEVYKPCNTPCLGSPIHRLHAVAAEAVDQSQVAVWLWPFPPRSRCRSETQRCLTVATWMLCDSGCCNGYPKGIEWRYTTLLHIACKTLHTCHVPFGLVSSGKPREGSTAVPQDYRAGFLLLFRLPDSLIHPSHSATHDEHRMNGRNKKKDCRKSGWSWYSFRSLTPHYQVLLGQRWF